MASDDDDDDGPGFLPTFLLLGGLGVGAWFLFRNLAGQAQAATALSTGGPLLSPGLDTAGAAISSPTSSPAAPGDPSLPAGIRNNNPGNIKWSAANDWVGQIGTDPSGFVVFSDPVYGLRAMIMVLNSYARELPAGQFTIPNIAARWTQGDPPAVQAGWISTVEGVSGISRNQAVDHTNPTDMQALVNGIVAAENGGAFNGYFASATPQAWGMAA